MVRLEFDGVTKQFAETTVPAVDDVSISIGSGESLAIVGPSGAGKTTLLRLAGGVVEPDSGRITVDGRVPRPGDAALVYQGGALLGRRTALENALAAQMGSMSRLRGLIEPFYPADDERAVRLLKSVGLGSNVHTRVDRLSAGERERVAIVRALLQDAELLLADEPTANLDPSTSETVLDLLQASRDRTLIAVLHDVDLAFERFDRIVGFADRRIAFDRSSDAVPTELLETLFEGRTTDQ